LAPDSGVKGALREHDDIAGELWVDAIYGRPEGAGEALIGGARLLLLPVRHLEGTYAWVTCPGLLERFWRDWSRLFSNPPFDLAAANALAPSGDGVAKTLLGGLPGDLKTIRLEDLALSAEAFDHGHEAVADSLNRIGSLMGDSPAAGRLERQIAVVTDGVFADFAAYALPVRAHNALDANKQSLNLWYEESLPPDTLLYAPIASRRLTPSKEYGLFAQRFDDHRYRRLGGNETTGQGWVRVTKVIP
jgi:CRISPR-associated protein Cmr4